MESFYVVYFVIWVIFAALFAVWGYSQGKKRSIGKIAGGLLGFFLGLIGIVIVLCSPKINNIPFPYETFSVSEEVKKYKDLLDSGAITREEYDEQKKRLLES